MPLSRAFGGARGGVRGTLASASAGGKNAGHRTGVPGSNAKPPTGMEGTTREETLRELRRRRAVIDSQTARLDELAARDKKEASSRGSSPGTSLASFSPVRRIPAFHTPGGGGESPGTPRGMSPGTTPGTPGTPGSAVSAFHTPFSSAGSDAGSEEGRAMASPVGGRRLAAPSDLDPAEENAVVRAVLSRISGPRVTSTVKKQKPRAAEDEDADAGDAPADDAPLAFAAVPPPVSKAETETEPPKPAAATGGFGAAFLAKANAGYAKAQEALKEDLEKAGSGAGAPAAPPASAALAASPFGAAPASLSPVGGVLSVGNAAASSSRHRRGRGGAGDALVRVRRVRGGAGDALVRVRRVRGGAGEVLVRGRARGEGGGEDKTRG